MYVAQTVHRILHFAALTHGHVRLRVGDRVRLVLTGVAQELLADAVLRQTPIRFVNVRRRLVSHAIMLLLILSLVIDGFA